MGRITRGYAIAALVFGLLELLAGIIMLICAIVLAGNLSSTLSVQNNDNLATFSGVSYWWTSSPLILPGIFGLVTFFTRSAGVATCHLILNIFCFLATGGCAIIGALLSVIWSAIANQGICVPSSFDTCSCQVEEYVVTLQGSCSAIPTINTLFWVITFAAVFGAIVILVSCYINCVSLCNQEQNQTAGVIFAPSGAAVFQNQPAYQTPPIVTGNTGYDGGHLAMQPPAYPVNENDKAKLVYNEA